MNTWSKWYSSLATTLQSALQACIVVSRFDYFDNLTVIVSYHCQISLASRLFAAVTKESCEQSGRHRILPKDLRQNKRG